MIDNLIISGVHFDLDEDLKKYVQKKIGNMDKYLPRPVRETIRVEVRLKGRHAKDKKTNICEVTLHLPHDLLIVTESAMNIYAAIDIAEAKLKNQLIINKTEVIHSKIRKAWLSRRQERRN